MKSARPLMCWDIFMESFHRRMDFADDLQQLSRLSKKQNWLHELDMEHQLIWLNRTVVVTDTGLNIVYASSNIFDMNGYTPDEVIGRKPSLFQGKETSPETKLFIRNSIEQQVAFETSIVNYRKNGDPYLCRLEEYPLYNDKKALVNFIAFECIV